MKIEYVMPDEQKRQIEDLQSKILSIEMVYVKQIQRFPFMENEIRKNLSEDKTIEMLRNIMINIYMTSPAKILVKAENKEEIERLNSKWRVEGAGARN